MCANWISLVLAVLVISMDNLGTRRASSPGEELKTQMRDIFPYEHQWLALYRGVPQFLRR